VAGNNNPWRDIFTPGEWTFILARASAPPMRGPMGGHRHAPPARWGATPSAMKDPAVVLQDITHHITEYDALPKDDCTYFSTRATKLTKIAALCKWYRQSLGATHQLGTKQATGKRLNDPIDIWVKSLGSRAVKKAGYLDTMGQWHATAKAKYKDRVQLSMFLRQLAYDNTSHGGEKLHATPYATIEKVDPYHRQTFVFLDPMANDVSDTTNDQALKEIGQAVAE